MEGNPVEVQVEDQGEGLQVPVQCILEEAQRG